MTTSAVRFEGGVLFVGDAALRELLKALAYHLPDLVRDDAATAAWLVEACGAWMDDHEASPPGLRDLELDERLTTPARRAGFADCLRSLQRRARPDDAYDAQLAGGVIERILAKWAFPT